MALSASRVRGRRSSTNTPRKAATREIATALNGLIETKLQQHRPAGTEGGGTP